MLVKVQRKRASSCALTRIAASARSGGRKRRRSAAESGARSRRGGRTPAACCTGATVDGFVRKRQAEILGGAVGALVKSPDADTPKATISRKKPTTQKIVRIT